MEADKQFVELVKTSEFPLWPHYSDDEIRAVSNVLSSGKVNAWTGPEVASFERKLAEFSDTRHAIALSNGTVSLEIVLKALGVGYGDEVVVTPRSFVASVACVMACGATPVFADVDRDSQNITAESISEVLTKKTRAIIPVHLAGWPCEMDEIVDLAQAHNIAVIEDCAQAHGARLNGRVVGSFGDAASWSFCQDKIISTGGEGGALTMESDELWSLAWSMKEHGKRNPQISANDDPSVGYKWMHQSLGSNARMTGMQAAIGILQLNYLPDWTSIRNNNAQHLWRRCSELSAIRCPSVPEAIVHGCYMGYIFLRPEKLRSGWSRDRILALLSEKKVPVTVGSCPELYREKVISDSGFAPRERLPVAVELGETSLAFPVHHRLDLEHIDSMVDALELVLRDAALS